MIPYYITDGQYLLVQSDLPDGAEGYLQDIEFQGHKAIQGLPPEGMIFRPRAETPVQIQWAAVRRDRDSRLTQSDWITLPDVQMDPVRKQEWLDYRQALRNITQQEDPFNIIWPVRPG